MHILCLGINHNTAIVSLRESLAFTPHRLNTALARMGCGREAAWNNIREMVILSTCNRVEIYAVTQEPAFDALESFLAEVQGVIASDFAPASYHLQDRQAVEHLFQVAAGLDSLVLGEPQILGQVTEAYSTARKHGTAGKILSRLFQTVIHAGKRARTETNISHNPASIASVAVNLAAQSVGDLQSARILVLGAGEMAELSVEALRKRGSSNITVVNRTLKRADDLARRWHGLAASLEALPELLPAADILIASTGAPHTILTAPMLEKAMGQRPERPLVIMDIAVPRDVDEKAGALPGVQLYDMDALSQSLEASLSLREAEVPRVETILAQEKEAFMEYLATLDVVPLIVQMRRQADAIREAELDKAMRRLPGLSPEALEQLDLLTKSIVKKILHSPTICLRQVAGSPHAADYAQITRGLFGLDAHFPSEN